MEGEWQVVQLGEVVDLLTGYPFKSQHYSDDPEDPRLVGGDNIVQGTLRWDCVRRWPRQMVEGLDAYWLRAGDIVLAMDRPWIEAGLKRAAIGQSDLPALLVQRTARLRGTNKLDSGFLRYVIGSREFTQHVLGMQTGTAVPHISSSQIKKFRFSLPPKQVQRSIAYALGTIDDKIELNRQTNETLEAMARALFKSWFVDFDPVRAKAETLIRDRLLEVGDGYRAKNSELGGPGRPFIRAGDLNNGFNTTGADILNEDSVVKAGSKVSRPGDVAFTSKGTIGRFARVTEHTPRFVYSPQVCFWRSLDQQRLASEVLYCWMQSEDFKSQVLSVAGQTDMAPYVSLRDQRQMDVPLFPDTQRAVADQMKPLFDRQALLAVESKTLVSLRDALLPRLLSGELTVANAERILEARA